MFDRFGIRKYLNDAERRAFLGAAKSDPDDANRAFSLTLFYTGCRISEALNLTTDRIDQSDEVLVFETLKRRKRGHFRAVPIPHDLATLFSGVVGSRHPPGRVWNFSRTTGYRLIKEQMEVAGIVGSMTSPKGLRHGFAVACLTQKIPLPTVQKWMGHARMETTAIYLDVSGNEERELAKRLWVSSE